MIGVHRRHVAGVVATARPQHPQGIRGGRNRPHARARGGRRLALLELQSTATRALLAAAPELAGEWRDELDLLAHNWLREAGVTYQFDTSTSRGPRMQRDLYGNFFYFDEDGYRHDPERSSPTRPVFVR